MRAHVLTLDIMLWWMKKMCKSENRRVVLSFHNLFRFTKCNRQSSGSKSIHSTPNTTTKKKRLSWSVSHDRLILWYKPKFIIFILINEYLFHKFSFMIYIYTYTTYESFREKMSQWSIWNQNAIMNWKKKLRIYGHEKGFGINESYCIWVLSENNVL